MRVHAEASLKSTFSAPARAMKKIERAGYVVEESDTAPAARRAPVKSSQ